ncbi:hypothetical protein HZC09_04330 [Candidatus Micrarchaeota archaeon]|nr:hypothetical protein [Candidatus Micrarchaeota archaeon]
MEWKKKLKRLEEMLERATGMVESAKNMVLLKQFKLLGFENLRDFGTHIEAEHQKTLEELWDRHKDTLKEVAAYHIEPGVKPKIILRKGEKPIVELEEKERKEENAVVKLEEKERREKTTYKIKIGKELRKNPLLLIRFVLAQKRERQ